MIRTQVYLPEDLHQELRLVAQMRGVNFSSLIREGVKKVIQIKTKPRKKEEWREFVGAWRGGPRDVSSRINDIYK